MNQKRFLTYIWVDDEGKNHNEAWENLNEKTKYQLNQTVELLKLMLQTIHCEYHYNFLTTIAISYEKATDITSTHVKVCCFLFAQWLQNYLDKEFPAPVNVDFLKPFDQRDQN